MSKINVYEMVTNRIVAELEKGIIPWHKPWCGVRTGAYSRATGKPYSLINQMLLGKSGEYLTFMQVKSAGGRVKKGEKSSIVVFYSPIVVTEKGKDGKEQEKIIPMVKYYNVFHIDQTEGVIPFPTEKLIENERIGNAEITVNSYIMREGISFAEEIGNEAYYRPSADKIVVPLISQFDSSDEYYSTLYREAIHSTGHQSRLNRITKTAAFGNEEYSKEELTAEIGSAMLCELSAISTEKTIKNSAAYVQSWLRALKNDNRMIVTAASKAEKAVDFIYDGTRA